MQDPERTSSVMGLESESSQVCCYLLDCQPCSSCIVCFNARRSACIMSSSLLVRIKLEKGYTEAHIWPLGCAAGLCGKLPVACSADTGRVLFLWDGAAEPLHVVHRLRLPAGALLPRERLKSCTM